MPRRNKSIADSLADLLLIIPWWVNLALGIGLYVVLEGWHRTSKISTSSTLGFWSTGIYAPLALSFFTLAAVASALWRVRDRHFVDEQTGLDSLRQTSWKNFERLVAEAYRRQGYKATYSMDAGPDGGVDVRLSKDGKTTLVQCKCWKKISVGVSIVREMFGILHDQKADHVIIVTTHDFTPDAQDFARGKPITLINGHQLWEMVRAVQPQVSPPTASLPEIPAPHRVTSPLQVSEVLPTETSPACPRCGGEMIQRQAKKGTLAGTSFWGCLRYPQCRGLIPISTQSTAPEPIKN